MFCSKCGNQASDTARFCNACGAPLQAAPAPAQAPAPASKPAEFDPELTIGIGMYEAMQKQSAPAAPAQRPAVDEFGVPIAPAAPAAPAQRPAVDEFGVPIAPAAPAAPAQRPAVDEFGVPIAPAASVQRTSAPAQRPTVDEFGVPIAPAAPAAPVQRTSSPVDQFGVPAYAAPNGGYAPAAKQVNKKLLIGIGAAVAAILVIILIIVLSGGGGGKNSKQAVVEASLKAMCDDPGDILDLMPSKVVQLMGDGMTKTEMREDLRDSFSNYEGYSFKSCKIEQQQSSSAMLEQLNSMYGTKYDEYCAAYVSAVFYDEYGDIDEDEFTFHLIKDGGKWYLMYFE